MQLYICANETSYVFTVVCRNLCPLPCVTCTVCLFSVLSLISTAVLFNLGSAEHKGSTSGIQTFHGTARAQ